MVFAEMFYGDVVFSWSRAPPLNSCFYIFYFDLTLKLLSHRCSATDITFSFSPDDDINTYDYFSRIHVAQVSVLHLLI